MAVTNTGSEVAPKKPGHSETCCHLLALGSSKVQPLIKPLRFTSWVRKGLRESVEWSSGALQGNQIQIWPVEVGSTQEKWHLPAVCTGEGLHTGKMKTVPRVLAPKFLNLSPYVSYVPRVTVPPLKPRVSACTGPLRRCLGFLQCCVPLGLLESLLFFTARSCGGASSKPSTPSWEGWGGELESLTSSWETPVTEISLLIFNHYTWVWAQLVSHLSPLISLNVATSVYP